MDEAEHEAEHQRMRAVLDALGRLAAAVVDIERRDSVNAALYEFRRAWPERDHQDRSGSSDTGHKSSRGLARSTLLWLRARGVANQALPTIARSCRRRSRSWERCVRYTRAVVGFDLDVWVNSFSSM
jgi:hypothetical protein